MKIFWTIFFLVVVLGVVLVKDVKCAGKGRTEEPEIMIDRNKVALDIPPELLGSSASITLRLSEQLGRLIENTVRRKARVLQLLNPLFGNALEIKIPPKTTTEANRK